MELFRRERAKSQEQTQLSREAAIKYSTDTLRNLGNLPRVTEDEVLRVRKYFVGDEAEGVDSDRYWKHVEETIELLRETNAPLADFIQEFGSDIEGRDGRDLLVLAIGMVANSVQDPQK